MIYGVEVYHREGYTDFYLITASSEESANDMLAEAGYDNFVVVDAEDLLNAQFDGLSMLATV